MKMTFITASVLAIMATGVYAQSTTSSHVAGRSATVASASQSSSNANVGGSARGLYSVENFSGASNISGAAITHERNGTTVIGVTETWSNGTNYASTNNKGGTGYANSGQAGGAAASYYNSYSAWTWNSN